MVRSRSWLFCALAFSCATDKAANGIVVGVLLDYTGTATANGANLERGALMAVKLIAEAHPNSTVRFIFEDTHGDPVRAAAAAERLVAAGAVAVLGPSGDELVAAVAAPLEKAGVLLFSPTATTGNDPNSAVPWFRMAPGNLNGSSAATLAGEDFGKSMAARGVRRLAIVSSADRYLQDFANGFAEEFIYFGGSIGAEIQITDANGLAKAALNPAFSDPTYEGFVVALDTLSAANLIADVTARVTPLSPQWLLNPRLKSDVFLVNTPAAAVEGALGVAPKIAYLNQKCQDSKPEQCFALQFEKFWHDAPFEDTYFMYDASALLLIAIDDVVARGETLSRDTLAKALLASATSGSVQVGWNEFETVVSRHNQGQHVQYSGLTGTITFFANGERSGGNTVLWKIENRGFVDTEK